MKILCLATNRIYLNNTQQLITLAIASISDVTFYGPGYVSPEVLKKGVKTFVEDSGVTYDFIYTDGMILFWNDKRGTTPFNISFNYFTFNGIRDYIMDMKDFYINYLGKKILYPNIDFYNVSKIEVETIGYSAPYLISWGMELLEYKKNLSDLKFETFSENVNDNWINYIDKNQERIISIPHIIGESEFSFHPLDERKYDMTVPGVNYHSRKIVNKIINNTKTLYINNRNTSYFQKINLAIIKIFTTRSVMKVFKQIFNNTIEDSKMAYTCGSGLNYIVRKYLEIPAKGTLLVCKPCKGFEALGFEHDKNCIVVNPKNILEDLNYYFDETDKYQKMAIMGQKLVWEKHSFHARSKQIKNSLIKIMDGSFKGSYWKKGEFKLR